MVFCSGTKNGDNYVNFDRIELLMYYVDVTLCTKSCNHDAYLTKGIVVDTMSLTGVVISNMIT